MDTRFRRTPNSRAVNAQRYIRVMLRRCILLAALVSLGILVSSAQWTSVTTTPDVIHSLASVSSSGDITNIVLGTGFGIYYFGTSASRISPAQAGLAQTTVNTLAVLTADSGSISGSPLVFAGTDGGGIYASTDLGVHWRASGLTGMRIQSIVTSAVLNLTFVATEGSGVFSSANGGTSWSPANTGLSSPNIHLVLLNSGESLLYASTDSGVFKSSNRGLNWTRAGAALPPGPVALAAGSDPAEMYAGTANGVYRSTDSGVSWQGIGFNGQAVSAILQAPYARTGERLYALVDSMLYISADSGALWVAHHEYFPISFLGLTGSTIWAQGANGAGLWGSPYGGDYWTFTPWGPPFFAFSGLLGVKDANGADKLLAGVYSNGVYSTSDGGQVWQTLNFGIGSNSIMCLAQAVGDSGHTILYAGASYNGSGGVSLSTDQGLTWTPGGLSGLQVVSFAVDSVSPGPQRVFALTYSGFFVHSGTDTNWTLLSSGASPILANGAGPTVFGPGGYDFPSPFSTGVNWNGLDAGNWSNTTSVLIVVSAESGGPEYVAANAFGEIYSTLDTGKTWNLRANLGVPIKYALTTHDLQGHLCFFFLTTNSGVYLVMRDGDYWRAENVTSGLPDSALTSIAISGDSLYAGTWGNTLWRRQLSPMLVLGVHTPAQLPKLYALKQNYPNPFNPTTTISYDLPSRALVKLDLYSVLGERIATLVNGMQEPGAKSIVWNARNNPSGVYFYRLQAGSFTDTKKLVLLR